MNIRKATALVLTVVVMFSVLKTTASAVNFTDVPTYSYYYDAAYWAYNNGVTSGTSPTTFSPNDSITRAQIVTFLWRIAGSPMGYQHYASQFTDVSSNDYFFDAVGWASYFGITSGTSPGVFSPNNPVKNKETVAFMYFAAMNSSITAVPTTAGELQNLNAPPSSWYYSACLWANNQGYLASLPEFANGFMPSGTTTRGMGIYMLWEMITGSSKVFIDVTAGEGISTVTLQGRTGGNVSGYYTKGSSALQVSCVPASGYIFSKWLENGAQIGINNPTFISVNGNRAWTAIGVNAIDNMIQYANAELGHHQADNNGYNIGGNWCAAFVAWCAYKAGLASGTYTLLMYRDGSWKYYKVSEAYNNNYSNPISYPWQVLRNTSCSQQIAHFCLTGHMYLTRSTYKTKNGSTRDLDWSTAMVCSTAFEPRIGDLVYFDWINTSYYSDHVGIVIGVSKNGTTVTITTIEGNTNGTGHGSDFYNSSYVWTHTYTFDLADESKLYYPNGSLRGYITGFGRIE